MTVIIEGQRRDQLLGGPQIRSARVQRMDRGRRSDADRRTNSLRSRQGQSTTRANRATPIQHHTEDAAGRLTDAEASAAFRNAEAVPSTSGALSPAPRSRLESDVPCRGTTRSAGIR